MVVTSYFKEEPDGLRSWLVALVAAVAMVFTFGMAFSYGVFLGPLSEMFGISTVATSTIAAVTLFFLFIGAGVVSVVTARYSARIVVLACAVATGLIAPALYVVETALALIPVFAIFGLALGTVYVTLAGVVPRWFERRRGAATGMIYVGNGLGLLVLPPAWELALQRLSLPDAFFALVGTSALTFGVAGLLAKRPPWADQTTATIAVLLAWVRRLLRTRSFQLIAVGIGLSFAWYILVTAYAIPLFSARGLGSTLAALTFGLIGGVSLVSRVTSGLVADRIGYRQAYLASLACSGAGAALLLLPQQPLQLLSVCLMGIGLGGVATLYVPLLMKIYSPERDTAIVGIFNIAIGVFALVSPPLGTMLIEYTRTFTPTIVLTFVMTIIAFGTVAMATDG